LDVERWTFSSKHLVATELNKIQNFIDGQFIAPAGGKYLDNIEPATGQPYSQVPDSDSRDVELAVAAAEKAFVNWSRTSATDRSRILLRIADLIERYLEKLARAESIDTGKPLSLARGLDIPRAASNFRFFATAILHTESEAHITDGVAFNYTLRQPRGLDLATKSTLRANGRSHWAEGGVTWTAWCRQLPQGELFHHVGCGLTGPLIQHA